MLRSELEAVHMLAADMRLRSCVSLTMYHGLNNMDCLHGDSHAVWGNSVGLACHSQHPWPCRQGLERQAKQERHAG